MKTTNTLTCLIVDDEPLALKLIETYVEKTPFLELKDKFSNGIDVMAYFSKGGTADLVFMDIQMPDLTGIDLAKNIPSTTQVIFTTAFDQYAIEGYKTNAVGYLLKPFDYAEFLQAAQKAQQLQALPPQQEKEYIFVKSEYKQVKIKLSDILYIEGLKDYVKIHLQSQDKTILTLMSLKKLTEELPKQQFMRVHRSYIVSLDKIHAIERGQILIGEKRITIAQQYKEDFDQFTQSNTI